MRKKKNPSNTEILRWANRADFDMADPWEEIRGKMEEPEGADVAAVRVQPRANTRRLVLVANLVLVVMVGVLIAGLSGVIRIPGIGIGGKELTAFRFPTPKAGFVAIAAGRDHVVGLRPDGTVAAAGDNRYGQCDVSSWTDIATISANHYQTLGVRRDGTVLSTGLNEGKVVGETMYSGFLELSSWEDIVSAASGFIFSIGLRADGTVIGHGDNTFQEIEVSSWTDIVEIAAGAYHALGLKRDGTVTAIGNGGWGQSQVSGWKDIVSVKASDTYSIGLRADGTVVFAGMAGSGEPIDLSAWQDIGMISAGPSTVAGLKKDGTVEIAWRNEAVDTDDWSGMVSIAAGAGFVVALDADGAIHVKSPAGGTIASEVETMMLGNLSMAELIDRGEIVFDGSSNGFNIEGLVSFFSAESMKRPGYLRVIRYTEEGDPIFYEVSGPLDLRIDRSRDRFGNGEIFRATYEHAGTIDIRFNVPSRLYILYNGELPTTDELLDSSLYETRWMEIASLPLSELEMP